MTQNEKDILLKDLCGRLPYGVKIVIQDTFKYSIVSREYHVLDVSNFSDIFCFNYKKFDKRMKKAMREHPNDIVIKPYLFPLSSMTEEQYYEMMSCSSEDCLDHMEMVKSLRECTDFTHWPLYEYRVIDWFNKNHFDYRGLIPMGLAIDATNKNIY